MLKKNSSNIIATALALGLAISFSSPVAAQGHKIKPPRSGVGSAASAISSDTIQVARGTTARLLEWRRVDTTDLAMLEPALSTWKARGGTTITLDVSFILDNTYDNIPKSETFTKIKKYVVAAKQKGLGVHATAGDPSWIGDVSAPITVSQGIADYNANNPKNKLASMTWNVEPWSTPEWQENPTQASQEFLYWVQAILALNTGVKSGVYVPYWFDGRVSTVSAIDWEGRTGSMSNHLAKIVSSTGRRGDFIAIMAYQDTQKRTLAAISPWLKLGIPVQTAITVSPSDPGSTWNGASWQEVVRVINLIEQNFGTHKMFRGVDLDSSLHLPPL